MTGCRWCGGDHIGDACPVVESLEYYPDGALKVVTFRGPRMSAGDLVDVRGNRVPRRTSLLPTETGAVQIFESYVLAHGDVAVMDENGKMTFKEF